MQHIALVPEELANLISTEMQQLSNKEIRRLAAAIILQSVQDAAEGDQVAASWLTGKESDIFWQCAGIERKDEMVKQTLCRPWKEIKAIGYGRIDREIHGTAAAHGPLVRWCSAVLGEFYLYAVSNMATADGSGKNIHGSQRPGYVCS